MTIPTQLSSPWAPLQGTEAYVFQSARSEYVQSSRQETLLRWREHIFSSPQIPAFTGYTASHFMLNCYTQLIPCKFNPLIIAHKPFTWSIVHDSHYNLFTSTWRVPSQIDLHLHKYIPLSLHGQKWVWTAELVRNQGSISSWCRSFWKLNLFISVGIYCRSQFLQLERIL